VCSGDGEGSSFVVLAGAALDVNVMAETADETEACRTLASEVSAVGWAAVCRGEPGGVAS
jgi:hypothetical protein